MNESKFDSLIAQLYSAPLDLSAWSTTLSSMVRLVQSEYGGQFHLWDDHAKRMLFTSVHDYAEESQIAFEQHYNVHYAAGDPRRRMVEGARPGEFRFDQDMFDKRFISRSEVYDFLRYHRVGFTAGAKLATSGSVVAALGCMRTPDQGMFTDRERRILARLSPHLVRAADLTLKFQELRERAALGRNMVDAISHSLFVLDRECRIRFENHAATRLLRHKTCLATAGFLRAQLVDDDRRLHRAVLDAVDRHQGSIFRIRNADGADAGVCRVVPLPDNGPLRALSSGRCAVLAISRSDDPQLPAQMLQTLYGLTPAQAQVAIALQIGASPDDIAHQLAISVATVRSHLKQVFYKTSTRRQAELVALLRSTLLLTQPSEDDTL